MFRALSSVLKRLLNRHAIAATAFAMLAGCAAAPTTFVDPSLLVQNADEAGTIVGTIGARSGRLFSTEGSPYIFNTLLFRKVGTKTGGVLEFSPPDPPLRTYTPDFQDEKSKGNVFSLNIAPGDYEIYSVRFYYNNGSAEGTFTTKVDFSVPFKVEKGKTTYLGSLVAWGVWGKNFLRMPIPAGGYFVVEDQRTRDLPLIQSRHPATTSPQIQLLQPDTSNPFVRRTAAS
jgi:hypothetical protein